jgi:hypothetical protein
MASLRDWMVDLKDPAQRTDLPAENPAGVSAAPVPAPRAGQRLRCATCGTQMVVVRAPAGAVSCCGAVMATALEERSR